MKHIAKNSVAVAAMAVAAMIATAGRAMAESAEKLLGRAKMAYADNVYRAAENFSRKAYVSGKLAPEQSSEALEILLASMLKGRGAEAVLAVCDGGKVGDSGIAETPITDEWRVRALCFASQFADAEAALYGARERIAPAVSAKLEEMLPAVLQLSGKTNEAVAAYTNFIGMADVSADARMSAHKSCAELMLAEDRREEAKSILRECLSADTNGMSAAALVQRASNEIMLGNILLAESDSETAEKHYNAAKLIADDGDVKSAADIGLASVHERQNEIDAALRAAERAVAAAASPSAAAFAKASLARFLCRRGDEFLDRAARLIDEVEAAARSNADGNPMPDVFDLRCELAAALNEGGKPDRVLEETQRVIEGSANAAIVARAQNLRGDAHRKLGNPEAAAIAYLRAANTRDADDGLRERCQFLAGEMQKMSGQYARAAETFDRFLDRWANSSLRVQAAYEAACCVERTDPEAATARFIALANEYSDTFEAARSFMNVAAIYAGRKEAKPALSFYDSVIRHPAADDQLRASAHVGRGIIYSSQYDFEKAMEEFDDATKIGGVSADQAAYLRIIALFNLNKEDECVDAAEKFLERRQGSAWEPDVTFWLGCYKYNRRDFAKAEELLRKFLKDWPVHQESDTASILLVRTEISQRKFEDALRYIMDFIGKNPNSGRIDEARFLHGDVLCELMRFDEAILVFNELRARNPESAWIPDSLGRKGDALFVLGSDTPAHYRESIAAYEELHGFPGLPFDQRLQAAYKIGRCNEKLDNRQGACDWYYDKVIVPYVEHRKEGGTPNERAKAWYARAALSVATLYEQDGKPDSARKILLDMAAENVPGRDEAAARAAKLSER